MSWPTWSASARCTTCTRQRPRPAWPAAWSSRPTTISCAAPTPSTSSTARGAIGVTERASYFGRMRDLTRQVARLYVEQRKEMGFPFTKQQEAGQGRGPQRPPPPRPPACTPSGEPSHLPAGDRHRGAAGSRPDPGAGAARRRSVPELLTANRLSYESVQVVGTPRRQAVLVYGLAPRQPDRTLEVQGPPAKVAFDAEGNLTRAGQGFAQKQGVPVEALRVVTDGDKSYVVATKTEPGRLGRRGAGRRAAQAARRAALSQDDALERDQRHLPTPAALAGGAARRSGRSLCLRRRGQRPDNARTAAAWLPGHRAGQRRRLPGSHGRSPDRRRRAERRQQIGTQAEALAASVGGRILADPDLAGRGHQPGRAAHRRARQL